MRSIRSNKSQRKKGKQRKQEWNKKRRNGRTFQEIKIQINKVLCFVQSYKCKIDLKNKLSFFSFDAFKNF